MSDESELDVAALMQEIREAVGARAAGDSPDAIPPAAFAHASSAAGHVAAPAALTGLSETAGAIAMKDSYSLQDFLVYHDEDFVANAYRGLLRREPDATGLSRFLARVRSGELAKVEVLGRIRFSAEGRAAAIPVRGLALPYGVRTLRRIPVIGYVLGIVQYVLRLPTMVRNLERLENVVFVHQREMHRGVNRLSAQLEAVLQQRLAEVEGTMQRLAPELERVSGVLESQAKSLASVDDRVGGQAQRLDAEIERLDMLANGFRAAIAALSEAKADRVRMTEALAELRAQKAAQAKLKVWLAERLRAQRDGMLEQDRRLGAILQVLPEHAAAIVADAALDTGARNRRAADAFYVEFENAFRGSTESVRDRVKVYLPYVGRATAGAPRGGVLDIGCGRGEWLELLRENNYDAEGVDINETMVAECRARGLQVVRGDGLQHLRSLESSSLRVITAFHVIEHLPFGRVLQLLDEIVRVLQPGGVAILETPNPENVVVGACSFWYDPTHQRPLPPPMMQFVLSQRGFTGVELLRLHPVTDVPTSAQAQEPDMAAIMMRFYGPQDYSVIGYKPEHASLNSPLHDE